MKQIENTSLYTADEGKLIVRKADGFIMGDAIDLGSADSIDNYEERAFSEEEIDAFYERYGINKNERPTRHRRNEQEQ